MTGYTVILGNKLKVGLAEALGLVPDSVHRIILDVPSDNITMAYVEMYGGNKLYEIEWGEHGGVVEIERKQAIDDDARPFPIRAARSCRDAAGAVFYPRKSTIPWWLAEQAYAYYAERFGNQQSLERIAERGGFGRQELVCLLRREI